MIFIVKFRTGTNMTEKMRPGFCFLFFINFLLLITTLDGRILADEPEIKPKSIGRFQYHQQGLSEHHPASYRFGFVSDDHRNPLSRHETSHAPGYVSGAYSYIDANNKWQVVHYESTPDHGFRIVNQWTKNRDQQERT